MHVVDNMIEFIVVNLVVEADIFAVEMDATILVVDELAIVETQEEKVDEVDILCNYILKEAKVEVEVQVEVEEEVDSICDNNPLSQYHLQR